MRNRVILVDEQDNPLGEEEKLTAHQKGLLHRAFSIFVFDTKDRMLVQKRAKTKYHSGNLWSNACCSHPAPGEETLAAAHRRLKEEMGFDCGLRHVGTLIYRAEFDNGLVEHEYDHMFIGTYDAVVMNVDPGEVEDWKWIDSQKLLADVEHHPSAYTYWFKLALEDVLARR